MNEHRTISMLQRLPIILAVTAASYGLPLQAQAEAAGQRAASARRTLSRPAAADTDRLMHDRRLVRQR